MPLPRPDAAPVRCFVALRPDDAARGRLAPIAAALARRYPGVRPIAAGDLHLTLAFIGSLDAAPAAAVAARLAHPDFGAPRSPDPWLVDRLGAFSAARVAWAGGNDAPVRPAAAAVRAMLDALGIGYDRKPFVPHVTLARGVARIEPEAIAPPIAWPIDAPCLLVSSRRPGSPLRYHPWPG